MVAIKALTVVALATAIAAAPVAQPVGEALVRREAEPQRGFRGGYYRWVWKWKGLGSSDDDDTAQTEVEEPAAETVTEPAAEPVAQAAPAAEPQTKAAAAPAAAAAAAPAASTGGSGYMAVVNQWRSAMGLSALAQDSKLEANALDTSNSAQGSLTHKLNPGSFGQVMAPGNSGNFESVFVGGWLCELPNLPGLGASVCNTMTKGWNHAGQTGHAEILTSPKYSKIGCGLATGIWTCDVA